MKKHAVNVGVKKKLKKNKDKMAVTFGMKSLFYEPTGKEAPIIDEGSLPVRGKYMLVKKDISLEEDMFYISESEKDDRIYNHSGKFNCVLKNGDLFDREESRMDKIKNHPSRTLHLKLPVPAKELAENLEFILVERFKRQSTNCDHGKCSMPEVYLRNHVNGLLLVTS
uniref:SHSP domain-containing protein n=1 Tax=Rhabditophanes sp. KR3021 TaxID=114890 RepID=A0AC35TQV6_9BILA